MEKLGHIREVLEQGGKFSGINRKAQLKPLRYACASPTADPKRNEGAPVVEEALLIMKWGGELTQTGREQAETLGRHFRQHIYPQYGPAGGGLLRLHATYRHDLKIYSSDEGRVQTSAAAFAKGLLDLETSGTDSASLVPILVSLVRKDANTLDTLGRGAGTDLADARRLLHKLMMTDTAAGPVSCIEDRETSITTMSSQTQSALSLPNAVDAGSDQTPLNLVLSDDSPGSLVTPAQGKTVSMDNVEHERVHQERAGKGMSADELLHATPTREGEKLGSKGTVSDHSPQSSPHVRYGTGGDECLTWLLWALSGLGVTLWCWC